MYNDNKFTRMIEHTSYDLFRLHRLAKSDEVDISDIQELMKYSEEVNKKVDKILVDANHRIDSTNAKV